MGEPSEELVRSFEGLGDLERITTIGRIPRFDSFGSTITDQFVIDQLVNDLSLLDDIPANLGIDLAGIDAMMAQMSLVEALKDEQLVQQQLKEGLEQELANERAAAEAAGLGDRPDPRTVPIGRRPGDPGIPPETSALFPPIELDPIMQTFNQGESVLDWLTGLVTGHLPELAGALGDIFNSDPEPTATQPLPPIQPVPPVPPAPGLPPQAPVEVVPPDDQPGAPLPEPPPPGLGHDILDGVIDGLLRALPGFLGGFSETEVDFSGFSPEEAQILEQLLAAGQVQQGILGKQLDFGELLQGMGLTELQALLQDNQIQQQEVDQQSLAERDLAIREQTNQLMEQFAAQQQQLLDKGLGATEEQMELIAQAAQAELDIAHSDVLAGLEDELFDITQRQAQARGLRPTDTPIQDLASRAARNAELELGAATQRVRDLQASAVRNFPLISAGAQGEQIGFGQDLATRGALTELQLLQDQFQNQLALLTGGDTSLLGLQGAATSGLGALGLGLGELQAGGFTGKTQETRIPGQALGLAGLGGLLGVFNQG